MKTNDSDWVLYVGGSVDLVSNTDTMLWYAAIAKITYQSTTETIFTLSIADEPQTSDRQEHTYIDHMALDGVTMFGTARTAHITNKKNYVWKLDFVDS